jgi:hypothetical protein
MEDREFEVPLSISATVFELTYRGDARHVVARDVAGRTIQLPAGLLRQFVTREGIQGVFIIRVDGNNKLVDIQRKNS